MHVLASENTEADVLSRLLVVLPVALTADLKALRSLQPPGVESLLSYSHVLWRWGLAPRAKGGS
eukprot:6478459-Amphidinium_carterae.1